MTVRFHIGDVFDVLRQLETGSVDLAVTSPPFLALRSYLPADHPDKAKEIGSESTPAAFIDVMLALTAELGRVLAPHGSICVELGDTFSGSGGAGGDYGDGGLREGQAKFDGSSKHQRHAGRNEWEAAHPIQIAKRGRTINQSGPGWPPAKSLTGIPTIYPWSLAYGRNLLTGEPSPAGQWRIRNILVRASPNPPVGSLGKRNPEKGTGDQRFRQAVTYITVACVGTGRYFDLDAVRTTGSPNTNARLAKGVTSRPTSGKKADNPNNNFSQMAEVETAGAPPLDWCQEMPDDTDGDWLWRMATAPYPGAHYATFPTALPRRLIDAMCPRKVCRECGRPSERIVESERPTPGAPGPMGTARIGGTRLGAGGQEMQTTYTTLGWTDCGHDNWRPGVVLDPFGGSGTTGEAANDLGRDAILIDLDGRNVDLARRRCGMFFDVVDDWF